MKNKITAGFLLIAFCTLPLLQVGAQTMPKDGDPKLWAQALKIPTKKRIVIDGHNDIPTPMTDEDFDLAANSIGKFHKDGDPFHTIWTGLNAAALPANFLDLRSCELRQFGQS